LKIKPAAVMNFVPIENFQITTKLDPLAAQSKLAEEVGPARYFSGFIMNQQFEVRRNINYRNSFLPQVTGTITKDMFGSKILVKMRPQGFVVAFITLWLSAALLAGVAFLIMSVVKSSFTIGHLIPFGMFLFGYALATGSFKFESIRSKEKLIQLVDGQIEDHATH
jgi:hypothetical protein